MMASPPLSRWPLLFSALLLSLTTPSALGENKIVFPSWRFSSLGSRSTDSTNPIELTRALSLSLFTGQLFRTSPASHSEEELRAVFPLEQTDTAGNLRDPVSLLPQYIGSLVPLPLNKTRGGSKRGTGRGRVITGIYGSLPESLELPEDWAGRSHARAGKGNTGSSLNWTGTCMMQMTASAHSTLVHGHLHILITVQGRKCRSLFCSELCALATPFRIQVAPLNFLKRRAIHRMKHLGEEEAEYVRSKGVAVFLLPEGVSGALNALSEVPSLLSNTAHGEALQLKFLREHMKASFHIRSKPWTVDLGDMKQKLSFISSGDLILTSKFRGPWGLFESLEKWVSGAWSGHMAIILRGTCNSTLSTRGDKKPGGMSGHRDNEDGMNEDAKGDCLWVAESGRIGVGGQPLIQIVTFEEWWRKIVSDPYEPQAVILPLHKSIQERWDNKAAWEFVRSVEGLHFGFHNFLFSWIDTPSHNFPKPLDAHTVAAVLSIWKHFLPQLVNRVMEEALNKRLGTEGLGLVEILMECMRTNVSFAQLLAIPEQDQWVYSDGISASCVGLAMRVWKVAGVFGGLTTHVNAGEFTIRDAYQLNMFEQDAAALPVWCTRNCSIAICQLAGKYEAEVPGYNTITPYEHMNEHCPSMPPDYERTSNC